VNFEIISRVVSDKLSEKVVLAERFSTGLQHFVFDVETAGGHKIVVRISKPEHRHLVESARFWNDILRPQGVPLPAILASDLTADFPYMILERLPGKDLGLVYGELSKSEKRALAAEMARLQTIAAGLPKAKSFGYLETFESDAGCRSWFEVVLKYLDRSRQRIKRNGYFETEIVEQVERRARTYEDYFLSIEPTAFFDDITTKNVIVSEGKLSGIVDVDRMCFGDSLQTVALTQTALLTESHETDYIEFWCAAMKLDGFQRKILDLYSALTCVDFLSEIGQTFNKDAPLSFDERKVQKLFEILARLLAKV
jgi:aminoglycoside phosphotransferase